MSSTVYSDIIDNCMKDPIFKAIYQGEMSWGDTETTEIQANVMQQLGEIKLKTLFPSVFQTNDENNKKEITPFVSTMKPITNGIKTLIVRNLPRNIMVEELRTLFELYGTVRDIYIPKNMDKNSPHFGTIKGFALVKYENAEDSRNAHQSIQGRLTIRGKPVMIEMAKEDR